MTIAQYFPQAKVILLTETLADCCPNQLLNTNVAGCLLKENVTESLTQVIQTVAMHGSCFERDVVTQLVTSSNQEFSNLSKIRALNLAPRELEVLKYLIKGESNAFIAQELSWTSQTIRNYVSRVYKKIGVTSREELMEWHNQDV